ncbi:hypothetical protein BGZ65_009979 [Modicella reniformis]|uniref:HPt domain-containing protein n=1 Tax=Modicella reniformis TaxID=1440133 RepID=A0A9P6II91_9FUNG|nr:hypothetical protein BGZ65_009979 [Modicella reniformis]
MAPRTEHPAPRREVEDNVDSDPETEEEEEEEESESDCESDDEIIDHATFDQLLLMDDDDDRDFSKSRTDFADMSRLGHFLKGSSAALGLVKIRGSCERLQHYGELKDAEGSATITDREAEDLIQALLVQMQKEYKEAQNYLTSLYED